MAKHPNAPSTVKELCELLDVSLIEDIDCENSDYDRCYPVFFLGNRGDRSVGIQPFEVTPMFKTKEELAEYCMSEKGLEEINKKLVELFSEWDAEAWDWSV